MNAPRRLPRDADDLRPGVLLIVGGSYALVWLVIEATLSNRLRFSIDNVFFSLALLGMACFAIRASARSRVVGRRMRKGMCLACGYDLRHSPVRCPECGRTHPPRKSRR